MKRPKLNRKQRQMRLGLPPLLNRISELLEVPRALRTLDSQSAARLRESYLQLREASYRLVNEKILSAYLGEAIEYAGSSLGMLVGNTLSLQTEDESAVLMDHAIFNYRVAGRNIVERYGDAHGDELMALERKWLVGAEKSRHTLVLIGESIPGLGMTAHDVFWDEQLLIVDLNFSRCKVAGLTLATRLIPIDDYYISSGAVLPIVSHHAFLEIGEYLRRTRLSLNNIKDLTPNRATLLESFIIRTLLDEQASERVGYADP
jgi:hypothetical protein